ncbi:DNA polymerase III subunit gamma and tau [Gulosibacter molinativorax]|uniref:DNA-directed DNA polymerase n=1 Tax=Gulosibacter molinativorax TaxID=256821 RepID=A0ABT7CB84_9MICO|nr:DNA polymerase III subunit gamma and tau [Gulosibacter molinativorax]MDJ1372461.1 DNA polymerase III subunit gamma and tau [Gulosibacter molinativorax]
MVAALYRRYRPESFAEMIGQRQVTDPLMTALRTGRINHAYLFSGPRGCGKTSSARILARCLNCAEGPTPEPCGKCESCLELGRNGGGSIDVFEIDAASHGGVDDARELRERAVVAPTRDRYKIFIIDEAHMVTAAGFNALLKVVEEPPENVMFIFATTEPEKVIGTIRSRTHHFPFRLIPPAPMLEYVEEICAAEGVTAQPGVLPLVVRAGGGSARDTMSLLDQLIAGTDGSELEYGLATQLLGFTSQGLLNDAINAFAAGDAAEAYRSVDAVIQSGQDPRRYVEDLLERVRDLIIVRALGESASSVLRGAAPDDLEQMRGAAARFSPRALSQMADIVNETLTEMSGVTAPRVQLELMVARILVAMRADFAGGAAGFVEAGETPLGQGSQTSGRGAARPATPAGGAAQSAPSQASAPSRSSAPSPASAPSRASALANGPLGPSTSTAQPDVRPEQGPASPAADAAAAWDAVAPEPAPSADVSASRVEPSVSSASEPVSEPERASEPAQQQNQRRDETTNHPEQAVDPGSFDLSRVRAAWPEVLEQIARDGHPTSAAIVKQVIPTEFGAGEGAGKLRVEVPNRGVMDQLSRGREQGNAPANHLKTALGRVFGFDVVVYPRVLKDGETSAAPSTDAPPADPDRHRGAPSEPTGQRNPAGSTPAVRNEASAAAVATTHTERAPKTEPTSPSPAAKVATWDVVAIPGSEDGPGSGWDDLATESATPTEQSSEARIPEVIAAKTLAANEADTIERDSMAASVASKERSNSAAATAAPTQTTASAQELEPAPARRHPALATGSERYGESVIRERLGARFVSEEPIEILQETADPEEIPPPDDFDAPPPPEEY